MSEALKEKIVSLIEGSLAAEGCEIADLALSKYHSDVTLRVFVYARTGPDLAMCAHLSDLIGGILDGTDLFESGYTLEVSSAGLDRPLTSLKDFRFRVGETVRIDFVDPKRKKQTAEIVSVADESVEFRDDSGTFVVPIGEIGRARIVF